MSARVNGTLIAHDLQLTPEVLALFRDGYLVVADQQQHLEEVDLMAANVLFGLGESLQPADQNDIFVQSPIDDREREGGDDLGPNGVADPISVDDASLRSPAPCLSKEALSAAAPQPSLTPPQTPEVASVVLSGVDSHDVASTSLDDAFGEIMTTTQLEEHFFDFERYHASTSTEPSAIGSGGQDSCSHWEVSTEADVNGGNHSDREASTGTESLDLDDEVIFIGARPVTDVVHANEDDDIVIIDARSIKPTSGRTNKAARKRRRISRSVVPYALVSRRQRRYSPQTMANLSRWRDFTALWTEISSVAMEKPQLRRAVEAMDGTVIIVDDDDRDLRLWKDLLKENWGKLSDEVQRCDLEFEGEFRRAGAVLQKIFDSY